MDWQTAFDIAIALSGFLGGWVLKSLGESMTSLKETDAALAGKVQAIEVLVAGQYVKRDDMEKHMTSIFDYLRRIENKLDSKMDKH